jgi:hypothetical protein
MFHISQEKDLKSIKISVLQSIPRKVEKNFLVSLQKIGNLFEK